MSILDELLAESAAANEDTFTFTVEKTGRKFTGKLLMKTDDLAKISKRSKHLAGITAQKTPSTYHPYLPISETVATGVALIELTLTEPRINTLDAIRLANKSGTYFLEIVSGIQKAIYGQKREAEEAALIELGEG